MTQRPWLPAIVLVAGLAITALAAWAVNDFFARAEVSDAARAADHATAAVRLTLDRAAIAVRAVRAIYTAGDVSTDQFGRFAQTLLTSKSVSALGFVRRVEEDNRAAYEARLTDPPGVTLGIWETDASGKPIKSPARPVHLVLEATLVPDGPLPAYGFDVASLTDRLADMQRALDRFRLTMTAEIPLATMKDVGITLFDPVVDRSNRLIGVAAGSITHSAIVDAAAQASGISDLNLAIGPPGTLAPDAEAGNPLATSPTARTFSFADRMLTVTVTPPSLGSGRPWAILLIVSLGLATTVAVLASIYSFANAREVNLVRGRLRAMLDGLGPIALLLAPDGTVVNANRAAATTFRRSESEMVRHRFEELIPVSEEEDKQRLHRAIVAATLGQDVRFDLKLESPDGRQVFDLWIRRKELTGNLVASAVDVTDRYEAEETQRLLMRELDHRMKNTLQVIQAIIRRTATTQESIGKFEQALLGRVGAMSRAHDLLANERWHGADLTAVIRQETEHVGSGHAIVAEGPHVRLNPKAALALSLVIHELGTNAAKYGALSSTDGKVEITWDVDRSGAEPHLRLRWRETGGPPVKPSKHRGFGSLLIERSIAYELDGSAELDYRHDGLVCIITAPLKAVRPVLTHSPHEIAAAAR